MRPATRPSLLSFALHSYLSDLRTWAGQVATGYVLVGGLMLAATVFILTALGVGGAACFHFIEVRYGASVAYAVVGGVFLVAGLSVFLVGRVLLKRPAIRVPRPHRQVEMLKRAMVAPAAGRLAGGVRRGDRLEADPMTRLLAAAAAVALVGWIVVSRFGHDAEDARNE